MPNDFDIFLSTAPSTLLDGCWQMLTNGKHDLEEVSFFSFLLEGENKETSAKQGTNQAIPANI